MTIDCAITTVKRALPVTIPDSTAIFDWRHCWYPIAFVQDLPPHRPHRFSLYGESLVLFRDARAKLACLVDQCAHRAAKLSDGRMVNGQLECAYHGWQFDGQGRCVHIPQLPAGTAIPRNACVRSLVVQERQGIVWVWAGEAESADEQQIPALAVLDQPGWVCSDFMIDLPYDQTYLIENLIDPAHADISHNGTQGHRDHAQPLEMEIIRTSPSGIQGRWRYTRQRNEPWHCLEFTAPNLVSYTFNLEKPGWLVGLTFHSLPLDQGRCRVLVRGYHNVWLWKWATRLSWLTHLKMNKTFEQDLSLIMGQQEQVAHAGNHLKNLYLPLKTSDLFAIEYRKWLDQFGVALPYYQGYSTEKLVSESPSNPDRQPGDRFSRHTRLCHSCQQAHHTLGWLRQSLIGIAILLTIWAIAIAPDSHQTFRIAFASLLAAVLAALSHHLKTRFEQ